MSSSASTGKIILKTVFAYIFQHLTRSKNHAHIFTNLDAVKRNIVRYNQVGQINFFEASTNQLGIAV